MCTFHFQFVWFVDNYVLVYVSYYSERQSYMNFERKKIKKLLWMLGKTVASDLFSAARAHLNGFRTKTKQIEMWSMTFSACPCKGSKDPGAELL